MSPSLVDQIRSRLATSPVLARRRNPVETDGLELRAQPTAAAVRWSPSEFTTAELAVDGVRPHQLFVRQDVLRTVTRHLSEWGDRFGFLLGRRFRCPESDVPWAELSTVMPCSVALPGRGELPRFRLLREAAAREGAKRKLELLGWYHQHRLLGLALTDLDLVLHRENFPEPWQCALVFVAGATEPAGAFIQPWDGQPYFKQAFVSFQELSDAPPSDGAAIPTCVNWSNYRPSKPVELEPPEDDTGWKPARRQPTHGGEELAAGTRERSAVSAAETLEGALAAEDARMVAAPYEPTAAEDQPRDAGDQPTDVTEDVAATSVADAEVPPTAELATSTPPTDRNRRPRPSRHPRSAPRGATSLSTPAPAVEEAAEPDPEEGPLGAAPAGRPELAGSWERFLAESAPEGADVRGPARRRGASPPPDPQTSRRLESGRPGTQGASRADQRSAMSFLMKDALVLPLEKPSVGVRERLRSWLRRGRARD